MVYIPPNNLQKALIKLQQNPGDALDSPVDETEDLDLPEEADEDTDLADFSPENLLAYLPNVIFSGQEDVLPNGEDDSSLQDEQPTFNAPLNRNPGMVYATSVKKPSRSKNRRRPLAKSLPYDDTLTQDLMSSSRVESITSKRSKGQNQGKQQHKKRK